MMFRCFYLNIYLVLGKFFTSFQIIGRSENGVHDPGAQPIEGRASSDEGEDFHYAPRGATGIVRFT